MVKITTIFLIQKKHHIIEFGDLKPLELKWEEAFNKIIHQLQAHK